MISFLTFTAFPLSAQEAFKMLAVNLPEHNAPSSPSAAAPPPLTRPHVPLTPVPGTPDTLASIQLFPARYRRRQLTAEEMDFIQVRGSTQHAWHAEDETFLSVFLFLSHII